MEIEQSTEAKRELRYEMKLIRAADAWNVVDSAGNILARCSDEADARLVFRGIEVIDQAQIILDYWDEREGYRQSDWKYYRLHPKEWFADTFEQDFECMIAKAITTGTPLGEAISKAFHKFDESDEELVRQATELTCDEHGNDLSSLDAIKQEAQIRQVFVEDLIAKDESRKGIIVELGLANRRVEIIGLDGRWQITLQEEPVIVDEVKITNQQRKESV
jgi:hypothetical protein